jgi:hypothetical protein
MGRVRRYKKLKSCDPFAKKKPVVEDPRFNQVPSDIEDDFSADEDDIGDGNIRVKEDVIKRKEMLKLKKLQDVEGKDNTLFKKMTSTNGTVPPPANKKSSNINDILNSENTKNLSKRSLKRLKAKAENGTLGLAKVQHEFQQELREIKHIKNVTMSEAEEANKPKVRELKPNWHCNHSTNIYVSRFNINNNNNNNKQCTQHAKHINVIKPIEN